MKCPNCGTENEAGFRFCVKCGVNLENPQDVNIEQLEMGGFHSEEDPASGGYVFGSGTFTISDTPSRESSSDLYTADELNDSDEEFDFSSFDEPFIPKLDPGRVALPEQSRAVRQAQINNMNGGLRPQGGMASMPQQGLMQGLAPQGGMPSMPSQQGMMQGLPPQGGMPSMPSQQGMMQGLPPQGGMSSMPSQQGMMQGLPPQNGMPVYGQPVMYGQPPVVGYDQNGMPIYGQPVMYGQPQIIGYDQSGMPVYGQPMMYGQPQIIGYDQSGMPVYGQPVMYPQGAEQPVGMPVPNLPPLNPLPPAEDKEKVEVPDDFWEFFDGGKATEHAEVDTGDFFGKRGDEIDGMKRFEKKKDAYMNDTPLVDASKLRKNEPAKFNKMYMKSAGTANPEELEAKRQEKHVDYMRATKNVDADKLRVREESKAWNIMGKTDMANADDLEVNVREHTQAMMAQADHAVEAMPKKPKTYNDEIDAIELPESMKAKKTNKQPKIPGLPEI